MRHGEAILCRNRCRRLDSTTRLRRPAAALSNDGEKLRLLIAIDRQRYRIAGRRHMVVSLSVAQEPE